MDSSLTTFAGMRKDVLLLPRARRVEFRGVGHEAPIDCGAPGQVGEELRKFFSGPDGLPSGK